MRSLNDIVRRHSTISPKGAGHLQRLVATWSPLADLCFADLLLFAPVAGPDAKFVVVGQMRPSTAQTMYRDDQVGRFYDATERPHVAAAFETTEIVSSDLHLPVAEIDAAIVAVPVVCGGTTVGVLTQESPVVAPRRRGELEDAYLRVAEQLAEMVRDGTFPYPFDDLEAELVPRVGDGTLILDADGKVRYSSPNGVSAAHRLGYHGQFLGRTMEEIGLRSDAVRTAWRLKTPAVEEIQRTSKVAILIQVMPLISNQTVDGALVLMRDVTDLRGKERAMVSMDATIRETHHRVKNGLQTATSLLRIQSRRDIPREAKQAIVEAERRIASIAVVHEILASSSGDEIPLHKALKHLLVMVEKEALVPMRIKLVGDGPVVNSSMATSLMAVVLELVQNALEHGYPQGSDGGTVTVDMSAVGSSLQIDVHDDGVGLPEGFDPSRQRGLGLTIIGTLVESDLGGRLNFRPAAPPGKGTVAELFVDLTHS